MLDADHDEARKQSDELDAMLEEQHAIVEDLKRNLQLCKVEQDNIRAELETLRNENQKINDMKEYFNRLHLEECESQNVYKKELVNLQERIALLETEKNSAMQLWHISLNTINALEDELKVFKKDGKGQKFYQEQANVIKESYSEAIKILEEKLTQARDNFIRHQALYQTSNEKIDNLTKENNELLEKYKSLQDKDRNNQVTIETMKQELAYAKIESNKIAKAKMELEKKLTEVKAYAENIVERDKETKSKMAEAIELIESAVREKDLALHREALALEEKARLEQRLNIIANEYDTKIQELNKRTRDEIELNTKRYVTEINELRTELKEKTMLAEKTQRELKYAEEELSKIRRDSSIELLEYEQKAKRMELQLQMCNGEPMFSNKYDVEIQQLKEKTFILENKLETSNDKLQKLEQQQTSNIRDQTKRSEGNNKDVIKQYSELENQIAKTIGDKENLICQLKSLKHDFEYEIQKRRNERHTLENKIQELENNLHKATCARENRLKDDISDEVKPYDLKEKPKFDITVESKCHCCQSVLSDHINKLQEKYDRKIKELINHVQVHQKLSKRWRDEAKSLTFKFQLKSREFRSKINVLQKENNELNEKLVACKQQLAQQTVQEIQRFNEPNEIR